MKRLLALLIALMMLFASATVLAEEDEDVSLDLTPEESEELFGDPNYLETLQEEDASESDYDEDTAAGAATDLTEEELAAMEELGSALAEEDDGEADVSDLEINQDLPDNVVNILLLGIDNRTVGLQTGRSDAIMICSINKNTGSVKLTSIARDTAVSIPGYKNKGPINTAFKFGSKDGDIEKGAKLAMRTVNRNFHMNIQYYVVVNIYGLAAIIESLGGIDMNLTKAEAYQINYELFVHEPMNKDGATHTKLEVVDGVQHLDGMQAVTYGRIRHLKGQNDINRNGRQRAMLAAVASKAMNGMDLTTLLTMVEGFLPYGQTNLTLDVIMSLGMAVLSGDTMKNLTTTGDSFGSFGIPMTGEYGYKEFSGKSCVYISEARMTKTLTAWFDFLYDGAYQYTQSK